MFVFISNHFMNLSFYSITLNIGNDIDVVPKNYKKTFSKR